MVTSLSKVRVCLAEHCHTGSLLAEVCLTLFSLLPFSQGSSSAILHLNNLEEGSYVFRLTVTDSKGRKDSDEATVIVKPGRIGRRATESASEFGRSSLAE